MGNGDLAAAWEYHQRTKHSIQSLRANRHQLDWEIQPLPYKIYPDLAPIDLPRTWRTPATPALAAIAGDAAVAPRVPAVAEVARLLLLAAGITRKSVYASGQEMYFRAAACTGALYHIDLYLVCGELPGLAAGVYHFGPHDFALRLLRRMLDDESETPGHVQLLVARQLRLLVRATELLEARASQDEVADATGARGFPLTKLMRQARATHRGAAEAALRAAEASDTAVKTGKLTDVLAVELLVVQLSALAPRHARR